jgi:hypothetical protein
MEQAAKEFIHSVWKSKDVNTFPGPHPVSIERKHLPLLKQNKYVVCEKTDGVRFMLLCFMYDGKKIALFVNRAFEMKPIGGLCIPRNTIVEGEMVDDKLFMIYDGNMVNGVDIQHMKYTERLKFIEPITKGPSVKIKLQMKTVWPISGIRKLEMTQFPYQTDGYVFTPEDEPVRMETHETMFKWKPLDRITVDFKVIKVLDRIGLYVKDRDSYSFIQDFPYRDELIGKIVECLYSNDQWNFVKIRNDKPQPNNRRTYFRTLVNIRENIQLSEFS